MAIPRATRRAVLRGVLLGGAGVLGGRAEGREASASLAPETGSAAGANGGFFDAGQRAALGALADFVLPGAARWGAVDYVEALLTAFDHDPPRIHAGGPYSGRRPLAENGRASDHHPPDGFADFLPLDRVAERAWRLRLFGSDEVPHPNRALLGPVRGLRRELGDGASQAAQLLRGGASPVWIWQQLPVRFREPFTELVVESCFGDPVYGGNRDGAGWCSIGFAGDSLPLGYTVWDDALARYRERTDAPLSALEPGPGRAPLHFATRAALWLMDFLTRRSIG